MVMKLKRLRSRLIVEPSGPSASLLIPSPCNIAIYIYIYIYVYIYRYISTSIVLKCVFKASPHSRREPTLKSEPLRGPSSTSWHDLQLAKVAEGRAAPIELIRDANAAIDECAGMSGATQGLSRLAARGKIQGNAERDFHRHVARELPCALDPFAEPCNHFCKAEISQACTEEWKLERRDEFIMLPHEVFSLVHDHGFAEFHHMFLGPTGSSWRRALSAYWDSVATSEWFCASPFRPEVTALPHRYIPLRLHGDDVAVSSNSSMLVVSLTSLLSSHLPNRDAKVLVMSIPLGDITPEGIDSLYSVIVWSCNVAFHGKWPSSGPKGECWDRHRDRHGQPLAGGFRFMIAEIVGDWKWLRESLRLPQWYGKRFCCHICTAVKELDHDDSYVNFTSTSCCRPRSHSDYVAASFCAFLLLIGFHISIVLADYMHIVCLGTLQPALASAMLELCEEGAFFHVGVQNAKIRIGLQLRQATQMFFFRGRSTGEWNTHSSQ